MRKWNFLVAMFMLLVSCSGTGEPTGTAATSTSAAPAASVVLSDDGCEYDGPSSMAVGQLRVEISNETSGQFDLHLWLLDESHQYEELAAHIDEEQGRIEAEEPSLGHPRFATLVAEATSEAEGSGELVTDLAAGTYGMVCIYFDEPESLGGMWPVGPLVISQ